MKRYPRQIRHRFDKYIEDIIENLRRPFGQKVLDITRSYMMPSYVFEGRIPEEMPQGQRLAIGGAEQYGSGLQQQPYYYPHDAENHLLRNNHEYLKSVIPANGKVRIVDIGCGNGKTTALYIEQLRAAAREVLGSELEIKYVGIDITKLFLDAAAKTLKPHISGKPVMIEGDFRNIRNLLSGTIRRERDVKMIYLMFGGTPGNFEEPDLKHIVSSVVGYMRPGDEFEIMTDSSNNVKTSQRAYENKVQHDRWLSQAYYEIVKLANVRGFRYDNFGHIVRHDIKNRICRSFLINKGPKQLLYWGDEYIGSIEHDEEIRGYYGDRRSFTKWSKLFKEAGARIAKHKTYLIPEDGIKYRWWSLRRQVNDPRKRLDAFLKKIRPPALRA